MILKCCSSPKTGKYLYFLVTLFLILPASGNTREENQSDNCYITAAELSNLLKKSTTMVVDIRSTGEYQTYHIANSLNIQPYLLQTRMFLRNRHVVLVGRAIYEQHTLNLCQSLQKNKLRHVYVLKGGINAWVKYSQINDNSIPWQKAIHYINPTEVYSLPSRGNYLVINLSAKHSESKHITEYFEHIVSLQESEADIGSVQKVIDGNKFSEIIIVSAKPYQYQKLYELNRIYSNKTIFFLDGGLHAIHKFEQERMAMMNKQGFTLQNIKGCSN